MSQRLMRLQLVICFLNWKIISAIICLWIKISLSFIFELIQQLSSSLGIDSIGLTDSRHWWIWSNILSQGNIDYVLHIKFIIFLQIDLSGQQVLFQKLKKWINLERQSFLHFTKFTCDFDSKIYYLDNPVFSSSYIFLVMSSFIWIINIILLLFPRPTKL